METIGTKNFDIMFFMNSISLKREFLYFDKFIYNEQCLKESKDFGEFFSKSICDQSGKLFKKNMDEIEMIEKKGLLAPFQTISINSQSQCIELHRNPSFKKIVTNIMENENNRNKCFGNIKKQGKNKFYNNFTTVLKSGTQLSDNYSLLSSLLMNSIGDTTIPTLQLRSSLKQTQDFKTSINAVVEKFPIIDDEISWEELFEYKEDPEAKRKLRALRLFANDLSKSEYNFYEVEEKLNHLMNEYENQIKLHKLKIKYYKYDVLLTSTLGIIENAIKLNFTEIGKNHLSLKKEKVDLLLSERNIVGNEIAYIVDTTDLFRQKK